MTDGLPPIDAAAPNPAAYLLPRQRWRLYLRVPAAGVGSTAIAGATGWLDVLSRSGLPLAGRGGPRGRVTPAAQLPGGVAGKREVVDIQLRQRLPLATVRDSIRGALPPGIALVDLHDVWLGATAAPAAVVAADYRLELLGCDAGWAVQAAGQLMQAPALPRTRLREKKPTVYDLRPLIVDLRVDLDLAAIDGNQRPIVVLRTRLRHNAQGVGRPDELLAALAEPPAPPAPASLACHSIARDRLVLEDDWDAWEGLA
jgi:radical SAM-linked protein